MERTASATWWGDLKKGRGEMSAESGVVSDSPYSLDTRFGDAHGTNPEELIGAAHAGCYSMALSKLLDDRGIKPERIDTRATVKLEEEDGAYAITGIHLDARVEAPGAERPVFEEAARAAKDGCPVSKALSTAITLDATLIT